MHLKRDTHGILSLGLLLLVAVLSGAELGHAQFWKLNALNDRDLFILETRSAMSSGICYKEVPGKTLDPDLRMRMISYCCEGYARSAEARAMKCDPICTEDCSNGICTAPDVCECYPGYERRGGRCEDG